MKIRPIEVADASLPEHPAVSVTMITYNHESFIAQAIDSVLGQNTSFDIELVIGEDASTDRTRSIVESYQRTHPDRIRVLLHDRNVGAPRNAMEVLRLCRGRYIAMLEGDDYWTDPGKLQAQVELLEANPRAIMCGARALVWRNGDPAPLGTAPEGDSGTLATYGIPELVRGRWWFRTCTKVFPADMLKRVPLRVASDWASTLWLMGRHPGAEVVFLDRVVGVYRVHPDGSWSGLSRKGQLVRDARTLYHVLPVFAGADREYLAGELHARVRGLIDAPDASARLTIQAALRAIIRCPGDRRSWRHLAHSVAKRWRHRAT